MASSRPIVTGEDYTADDINSLRNDVLDPTGGHKHNGTDGAKVPFANLDVAGVSGSSAPTGGSASYNQIATHIASSQGQHALASSAHVVGCSQQSMMIQAGYSGGGGSVTFPLVFSDTPTVVITTVGSIQGIGEYAGYSLTSVSVSGFTWVKSGDSPDPIMWIAIGSKTS